MPAPLHALLLIDDSEADLAYTEIVLQRSGVVDEVLSCDDAADALVLLSGAGGERIELVLLDINMPGMDGWGFLAAYDVLARMRPALPPVVMLTSSPDPQDRQRAQGYRCVRDCLTKPLTPADAARLPQQRHGGRPA